MAQNSPKILASEEKATHGIISIIITSLILIFIIKSGQVWDHDVVSWAVMSTEWPCEPSAPSQADPTPTTLR